MNKFSNILEKNDKSLKEKNQEMGNSQRSIIEN
jgi:hypothetical protein